jgi:hypothetical protein
MEFVNFLKNPSQYLKLGAKIPKVIKLRDIEDEDNVTISLSLFLKGCNFNRSTWNW